MRVQVSLTIQLPEPPRGTEELYEQGPGGCSWQEAWVAQKIYDGIITPALNYHGMEIITTPANRLSTEEAKQVKTAEHDFWMTALTDPDNTQLKTNIIP